MGKAMLRLKIFAPLLLSPSTVHLILAENLKESEGPLLLQDAEVNSDPKITLYSCLHLAA